MAFIGTDSFGLTVVVGVVAVSMRSVDCPSLCTIDIFKVQLIRAEGMQINNSLLAINGSIKIMVEESRIWIQEIAIYMPMS